jgi:hypothetical protein
MARIGSQQLLRRLIADPRNPLGKELLTRPGLLKDTCVKWRSPISPQFTEYRDGAALRLLEIANLSRRSLEKFWPSRGPVWDALAQTCRGSFLFLEAKAHVEELASGGCKAGPESRVRILATLGEVRRFLAPDSRADWCGPFYQYANRLATLYLLRHVNSLPAHLVFLYFTNAEEMNGPRSPAEWNAALTLMYATLGLPKRHKLARYVHNVFVDAKKLDSGAA